MKNNYKYSIISAYVNKPELALEFLQNLDGKLPRDTEVLMVNAGNSVDIDYEFRDGSNYHLLKLPENKSFSNSMNTGLLYASGDYMVVIGNDTFPQSTDWVKRLENCFIHDDNCMIATADNTEPGKEAHRVRLLREEGPFEYYLFLPAVCWMLSRETVDRIGYFDEDFVKGNFEDNDYAVRVRKAGGCIILNNTIPKLVHRCSSESSLIVSGDDYRDNHRLFLDKHKPE